ncbi:hypothetical protein [Aneurinibacillus soli]|uniref:hypothetical protein n=1 Tax=Aneurinibacillus soli TaxID=1500254 RepID=UPI001E48C3EE|nr:hypothetical protein [Aneurinibacillus soli]
MATRCAQKGMKVVLADVEEAALAKGRAGIESSWCNRPLRRDRCSQRARHPGAGAENRLPHREHSFPSRP